MFEKRDISYYHFGEVIGQSLSDSYTHSYELPKLLVSNSSNVSDYGLADKLDYFHFQMTTNIDKIKEV